LNTCKGNRNCNRAFHGVLLGTLSLVDKLKTLRPVFLLLLIFQILLLTFVSPLFDIRDCEDTSIINHLRNFVKYSANISLNDIRYCVFGMLWYNVFMKNPKEINVDSMLIAIGQIIKEQKERLDLTVADLSEKSGVSVGVISDLINNRGRVPSFINFVKLAIALELPEDMFTGLIQGKIEQVQKDNKCSREDVEQVLLRYGLKKESLPTLMAQIDAILQIQCSNSNTRSQNFGK